MATSEINVITGAFGYTGKYITRRLLAMGKEVGPEIFTFEQLVRLIMEKLRKRVILTRVQPRLALSLAKLIEPFIGDVLITREEVYGLMADLLISHHPPTGHTHLSDWLEEHRASVGKRYASELARHYK